MPGESITIPTMMVTPIMDNVDGGLGDDGGEDTVALSDRRLPLSPAHLFPRYSGKRQGRKIPRRASYVRGLGPTPQKLSIRL
jgi:hypothetical protein